jgi:hypothetical protein
LTSWCKTAARPGSTKRPATWVPLGRSSRWRSSTKGRHAPTRTSTELIHVRRATYCRGFSKRRRHPWGGCSIGYSTRSASATPQEAERSDAGALRSEQASERSVIRRLLRTTGTRLAARRFRLRKSRIAAAPRRRRFRVAGATVWRGARRTNAGPFAAVWDVVSRSASHWGFDADGVHAGFRGRGSVDELVHHGVKDRLAVVAVGEHDDAPAAAGERGDERTPAAVGAVVADHADVVGEDS